MVTSTKSRTVNIQLPPLHAGNTYYCKYHDTIHQSGGGQLAVVNSPARFKVVMCGRRWGKTVLGVWLCIRTSLQGGRTWWVAPTYKIANEGWVILKRIARQLEAAGLEVEVRESDKQILFAQSGGMVEVRTSDVEDSLRGAGLDGAVIDEAASHRESAWFEELRHALIDHQGWALFIGTPKGKNWFTRLFDRGNSGLKNWASWKFETWDNPTITSEEKDELEVEYAGRQDKYRQEILADIGASQFLVYPEFSREVHMWRYALPQFVSYYGGLDFGGDQIGAHKSAGIIGGLTATDDIILLDEFEEAGPNITERQINWIGEQEGRLALYHRNKKLSTVPIFWRGDKSQSKFLDILRTYGYRVTPNKGNTGSVRAGIDLVSARLAVRNGKPKLYYLPHLTKVPEHFENYHNYEPKEGDVPQRDNPVKVNDDLDDAIRYLIEGKDGHVVGDPQKLYGNILSKVR